MKLLFLLAWRNLWRHPGRTAIILFAVSFGVWSMLVFAAYARGMMEQQINNTIRNLIGHIQIHAPEYLDDPVIQNSMPPPTPALTALLQSAAVKTYGTRIRVPAVISSERESTGLTLLGIEPDAERALSFISEALTEGRYLRDGTDRGVIIGRRMLERLETSLGKRVVLMSQGSDGELAERGFRIVGVYHNTVRSQENLYAFTGIETARKMLGMENNISEISMLLDDPKRLAETLAELRRAAPNLDSQAWTKLNSLTAVMLETFEGVLFVWYLAAFTAMAFGLVNTLLMAVFERTREFILLQALGMKPGQLLGQIMLESLFLLLLGLFVGNSAALLTLLLGAEGLDLSRYAAGYEMIGFSSLLYPAIQAFDFISANLLILVLGLAAALYPAWQAAAKKRGSERSTLAIS